MEKKRRGRPPKGERPLTPAERMKASRARKTVHSKGLSAKGIGVTLTGQAAWALDDLQKVFRNKLQKEIIEDALVAWMLVQNPDWAGKGYKEPGERN
ncbi:MAG: hypothetical protein ACYC9S_04830 [Leptospirales bacterium]